MFEFRADYVSFWVTQGVFYQEKIFFLAKEHGKISSSSSLMSRLSYDCPAWIKSLLLAFMPAPMLNR